MITLRPAILLSFCLCVGLMVAGLLLRPIFPVDETRYLTVAWEMHQSRNWVLPTLNGEAYHHKPPVLFWLINILWLVFGVSQKTAMIVPFLTGFSVLVLTARLATRLFPTEKDAPLLSVALLAGSLPFVLYANLIMFDLLLSVAVLLGVTALWDFFKTQQNRHIFIFAAAIGAGLLIKGPAVLLHMAPSLLLVRYWMGEAAPPVKTYVPKILGGLALGIIIALCWAIPAAMEGGKEFSEKIFYGQTTGRMVNAFDHKHPAYWYVMFLPLFVVPWVFSSALWRGLKIFMTDVTAQENKRFLLSWLAVVFVAFSFISGKQVHYLLPLMPPLALVLCAGVLNTRATLRKRDVFPILIGVNILVFLPVVLHLFADKLAAFPPHSVHMEQAFQSLHIWPAVGIGSVLLGLGFMVVRTQKIRAIALISVAMMLVMGSFQLAASTGVYPNYNLENFGAEIERRQDQPLAFAGKYHGEFGFLARLQTPLEIIAFDEMPAWFKAHPTGHIILYTKTPAVFAAYTTLMSQPYRLTTYFLLLGPKDRPVANADN